MSMNNRLPEALFASHVPAIVYLSFPDELITKQALVADYLHALQQEIQQFCFLNNGQKGDLDALLMGGGGVWQLSERALLDTSDKLKNIFNFALFSQISIEIEAKKEYKKYVEMWHRCGINRVCVRVCMQKNGKRKDDASTAHAAVHAVDMLIRTLVAGGFMMDVAITLEVDTPSFISQECYAYITFLTSLPIVQIGFSFILNGDRTRWCRAYDAVAELLMQRGFEQFDLLHFARPGKMSRYVHACTHQKSYKGFGAGAQSSNEVVFTKNYASLTRYIAAMKERAHAYATIEVQTSEVHALEHLMTGLRRVRGVPCHMVEQKHVPLLVRRKLLKREGDSVRLTPYGLWVEDEVVNLVRV